MLDETLAALLVAFVVTITAALGGMTGAVLLIALERAPTRQRSAVLAGQELPATRADAQAHAEQ